MKAQPTRFDVLVDAAKELQRAERKSLEAAAARSVLPPGSSRARVTTANARWSTAAEARDRAVQDCRDAIARAGLGGGS